MARETKIHSFQKLKRNGKLRSEQSKLTGLGTCTYQPVA